MHEAAHFMVWGSLDVCNFTSAFQRGCFHGSNPPPGHNGTTLILLQGHPHKKYDNQWFSIPTRRNAKQATLVNEFIHFQIKYSNYKMMLLFKKKGLGELDLGIRMGGSKEQFHDPPYSKF